MFSGCLAALVTPMRREGAIDLDAWTRLLEWQLAEGTSGVVVGGTTGESASLTDPELHALAERAVAICRGRAPVLAGAGMLSTAQSVERASRLSALGVDALLVVTPAYVRPTQEGLFLHYRAVAEASRVPLVLYNVPSRTAVDLLPETVARLARDRRIVAVKEAVADAARVLELLTLVPPGFAVLSGDDPTARQSVLAGAKGVISVTANVAPRAMARMIAAACAGDEAGSLHADQSLVALHRALFVEPNPIPVKWALAHMGLIDDALRLPLTRLAAEHEATVIAALEAAHIPLHQGEAA